jgi:SAM-dependent methyltransferase
VQRGRIGVGCLRAGTQSFLREVEVDATGSDTVVDLDIQDWAACGDLVIRNTSPEGSASELILRSVEVLDPELHSAPYLVRIPKRTYSQEPIPSFAEGRVFDDDLATHINRARLAHLASLRLELAGRRVLDVGCGVGHFADFYVRQGCDVVGLDGRTENIEQMARRYPRVRGCVGDAQDFDLSSLGTFDIVHCYGLLYHLDNPVAALRRMEAVCNELLVLETIVCDSSRPLMILVDEDRSANQALAGLACRPSPSFVAMALNRIGFPFVYGARTPPVHEDFQVDWRDDMSYSRDGHNLRCIMVASRRRLDNPELVALIQ